MKTLLRLLLGLCVSATLTARVFAESDEPKLSPEETEKLVAPIALYPDSLVALIMPASTTPSDVVLAARFFAGGGQQADIDKQFWSDSVKSLAHYPDIIKWMDENLAWTQQMGEVFAAQPADVMAAIQRLRVQAHATGLLTDTPQQRVVVEQQVVYIVPADPEYIYIPRYDPEILWMRRSYSGPFLSFSVGFGVGNWLFYDCDWSDRVIYVQRRHPGWSYHPGWRPPPPAVRVNVVREWHPDPRAFHSRPPGHRPPSVAVIPRPIGPEHHVDFSERHDGPGRRDDSDHRVMPDHSRSRPTPPPAVGGQSRFIVPSGPSGPRPMPGPAVAPSTQVRTQPSEHGAPLPSQRNDNPSIRHERGGSHIDHAQPPTQPAPPAQSSSRMIAPVKPVAPVAPVSSVAPASTYTPPPARASSRPSAPPPQPPASSGSGSDDDSNGGNNGRGRRGR